MSGPNSRYTVIDTDEMRAIIHVNFSLGGAAAFFGVPLREARDSLVDLADLWGRDGAVVRERLLEARSPDEKLRVLESMLLEHLAGAARADPALAVAGAALDRGEPVAAVCERLGIAPSSVRQRFQDDVGLSPKRFSRVRRLQRVVRTLQQEPGSDWAGVALDHGYWDQAHFSNDFRELAGITPSAYQPRSATARNHVPVAARAG